MARRAFLLGKRFVIASSDRACEGCVFGRGYQHAGYCDKAGQIEVGLPDAGSVELKPCLKLVCDGRVACYQPGVVQYCDCNLGRECRQENTPYLQNLPWIGNVD